MVIVTKRYNIINKTNGLNDILVKDVDLDIALACIRGIIYSYPDDTITLELKEVKKKTEKREEGEWGSWSNFLSMGFVDKEQKYKVINKTTGEIIKDNLSYKEAMEIYSVSIINASNGCHNGDYDKIEILLMEE